MDSRGLDGVVAAVTHLSRVRGVEGRLTYAGYEIDDLARNASFEETCHLLWHGTLPNRDQLDGITRELRQSAFLDPHVLEIIVAASPHAHPMSVLRTAVSAAGVYDPEGEDTSVAATLRKGVRLTARAVTMTAAIGRCREGRTPIAPRDDLGLAANLLYMLRGTPPDEVEARTLDVAFVLHAEHGMNASTFAARVAAATLTDLHSAVVAAIGTLKGPLHGGANEGVMRMLMQIGSEDNAADFVRAALDRHERIMGFGHRVYRTLDPRAPILQSMAERLQERTGDSTWLRISERVQETMRLEMERRGRQVYPNVDFYSASVYYTLGFPMELFPNIFACARMPGWVAHIMEQQRDNRLIRPGSEYVGPDGLHVVPIDERV
jgi:2-methylcitrate synthase